MHVSLLSLPVIVCPLSQNKVAFFDPGCRVEQTSLLYVWEGTGKYGTENKYLMYAGESGRFVPGRQSRLPSIYNINYQVNRQPAPLPDENTPTASDDSAVGSTKLSAFLGFTTALTFFVMGC